MRIPLPRPRVAAIAIFAICALTSMLSSAPAMALAEDSEQPLRVRSLHIERDQESGDIIYTGDVQIVQGSLRITADKVVLKTADEEVVEIIATGVPATIQQQPAPDEDIVRGRGDTIHYDVVGKILTFSSNASIRQGDSSLQADRLKYYLREQRYEAESAEASEERDGARVRVEIPATRLSD